MSWQSPIIEVRQAYLRAAAAEKSGQWHLVVQQCLYCVTRAAEADDIRAVRYFADKLAMAYARMDMPHKAHLYRSLS